MDWLKASVFTSSYGIEPVCGILYQSGISGLEIDDKEDFKTFLKENKASWDYVDEDLLKEKEGETRVSFYVLDAPAGYETLNLVKSSIKILKQNDDENLMGRLVVETSIIHEEDWTNNWKKYFKPLNVGKNILICPEWEDIADTQNRLVFKIDPGMSFGTGSHETTQLCIEELEKYVKNGCSVLDLGCGSGILSIISMLLGAGDATAIDIDPYCTEIAVKNARKNGIDISKYKTLSGNILEDEKLFKAISVKKYDIVIANIVADVIIGLKNIVPHFLKDDGIYITSGIIDIRFDDVLAAYKCDGFDILDVNRKGEWCSVTLRKKC